MSPNPKLLKLKKPCNKLLLLCHMNYMNKYSQVILAFQHKKKYFLNLGSLAISHFSKDKYEIIQFSIAFYIKYLNYSKLPNAFFCKLIISQVSLPKAVNILHINQDFM